MRNLVGVVVFLNVFVAQAVGAAERPNVLFLISDDLNTRIGCYGDPQVKTPNIDRIAARGVRFEHAYCQYPLCGPSRNSMLTGLYPNSTGIIKNAQIFRESIPKRIPLPQAFRNSGYFAARIGKLYHYHVPRSVGTNGHDDPASWEMEINPAGCDRLIEEPDIFTLREGSFGGTLSWYASPRPDEEHTDGMMADDAAWVLERCAKQKRPFFLTVGFYRPHTPYVAPEKYFEPYALDKMPVISQESIRADVADVPRASLLSHKNDHDKLTDPLRRECLQAYYASTTFMDAQVGKVLDALEANGLTDNTIVVFCSDHGYHLGEKGLWQKMSLFEQSARVPMIISAPGIEGGVSSEAPTGLIDLYPTLAALCDVDAPAEMHGQSLVPTLKDPEELGRGFSLSQVQRSRGKGKPPYDGYSIRTPSYRLTLWDGGAMGSELYDHDTDPLEQTNLLAEGRERTSEVDAVATELSAKLNSEVTKTYPESGERPSTDVKGWIMDLTNP